MEIDKNTYTVLAAINIAIDDAPPHNPLPSVNKATAIKSIGRRPKMSLSCADKGSIAMDARKYAFGIQM
jgi:hypothetical protein